MAITPNIQLCCGANMTDWKSTKKLVKKIPHFYCHICGDHFYKRKWYTRDAWFYYINEVTYAEYQRRVTEGSLIEDSPHAHELINHSDPEAK